jgi:hypothetical protein
MKPSQDGWAIFIAAGRQTHCGGLPLMALPSGLISAAALPPPLILHSFLIAARAFDGMKFGNVN